MQNVDPDLQARISELVQKVRSAPNEEDATVALADLRRLGAKLSPDDLKRMAPVMCDCGPSGEHPVESWPCW